MQTSIWTTGSTSKGGRRGSARGICKSVITQSKSGRLIVKLLNPLNLPYSVQKKVAHILFTRSKGFSLSEVGPDLHFSSIISVSESGRLM